MLKQETSNQKVEISIDEILKQNTEFKIENEKLKHELDYFRRLIFGKKSERFISNEPTLPPNTLFTQDAELIEENKLENLSEEIVTTQQKTVRKKGGRKEIPAHLHREITVIEPDDLSEDMKCIGILVTEELEYTPGVMYVKRTERPKYVDPITQRIVIAAMPPKPINKCIAGPQMMSHVIVQKYMDHLPLYRQLQQFKRNHNVDFSKSSFGQWVSQYVELLTPVYDALVKTTLSSNYIQNDESPYKVKTEEKKGNTHLGYMWATRNPQNNLIIFSYQKGRSSEHLHNHISSFRGIIQVDGYAVYDQLEYINGINIVSCWAHTRRYFEQALENDKERAEYVLKKIRKLYLIEQRARDENMNIESRKDLRKAESKTILDEIKDYLEKNVNSILPTSAIGKAFAYTLKRWDKLTKYVELGQVEIDNNLVENVIRPIALGRKNYLFAGSHESAQRAAMIYSLLGTCKINNLNPMEWLHDIFLRINDHPINQIEDLLPHNWIKTRSEI